jgi:hypothetical protein
LFWLWVGLDWIGFHGGFFGLWVMDANDTGAELKQKTIHAERGTPFLFYLHFMILYGLFRLVFGLS